VISLGVSRSVRHPDRDALSPRAVPHR
jgi:hypothetical protein